MGPTTTYWPPTTSPGRSFGVKENGVPQEGQKPSARPGWPSWLRPTGLPQWAHDRFDSATPASVIPAPAGSSTGTASTTVSPAPRRLRTLADELPMRWVGREPARARADPRGLEPSRADA